MTPIPPPPKPSDLVQFIWIFSTGTVVLMAFLCLLWSLWLVKVYYRDGRRQREGLCLRCGYDLRHANDRCPECGETVRTHRPDKFHPR